MRAEVEETQNFAIKILRNLIGQSNAKIHRKKLRKFMDYLSNKNYKRYYGDMVWDIHYFLLWCCNITIPTHEIEDCIRKARLSRSKGCRMKAARRIRDHFPISTSILEITLNLIQGFQQEFPEHFPAIRMDLKRLVMLPFFCGKSPKVVAASACYFITCVVGKWLSQERIAEYFQVTTVSIRNNYLKITKGISLCQDDWQGTAFGELLGVPPKKITKTRSALHAEMGMNRATT